MAKNSLCIVSHVLVVSPPVFLDVLYDYGEKYVVKSQKQFSSK